MEVIIQAQGLSKTFRRGFFMRRVFALRDLDLTINRGEIFGYLGPNGAGKTTTMKLLVGLISPTRGNISIWGKEPWRKEVRAKIGFLPETPYFYDYLQVEELLRFYGRLCGLDRHELKRRSGYLLERLGLATEANTPLRQLSKGNIQRVGLAQALLNDPELLILDEPMSGLDPIGRREVRDLILQLHEEGKTVLFSTHILSDVETICDRVGILVKGQMRRSGPLGELLQPKVIAYELTATGVNPETAALLRQRAARIVAGSNQEALLEVRQEEIDQVLEVLLSKKARIVSMVPKRENLERVFLREVEKADEDGRGHSSSILS